MSWCLYYEDGTRFTDRDGAPHESPVWGVVAVGQPQENRIRKALFNGYAYLYRTDWQCWTEVDDMTGFWDQAAHSAHVIGAVRFGRYARDDVFREIKREVEEAAEIRRAV